MTAQTMTLNDYLSLPWKAQVTKVAGGGYRLTVPQLPEFELFGSKAELTKEWKMALRSYLRACLAYNKVIPLPALPLPKIEVEDRSYTVNWRVGVA